MPVDPNHIYAAPPHEKTIQRAGFLTSCNSIVSGDTGPRGRSSTQWFQDGWTDDGRRIMVPHTTHWNPIRCGTTYEPVMGPCGGCANDQRRR